MRIRTLLSPWYVLKPEVIWVRSVQRFQIITKYKYETARLVGCQSYLLAQSPAGERACASSDTIMSSAAWADATSRAAAGQPEHVRVEALGTLCKLARDDANQQLMWADAAVRAAVVDGAAAGQPEQVRVEALGTLFILAGNANRQPMWANAE
eukprot:2136272-Prymnesium_polylepis.1